jgi:hypothetical protein
MKNYIVVGSINDKIYRAMLTYRNKSPFKLDELRQTCGNLPNSVDLRSRVKLILKILKSYGISDEKLKTVTPLDL